MKIAVLKSGAIGDILMATPFLRALRKRFPNAIIDFHTGKWSAKAVANNHNLNRVFAYDDSIFHSKKIFSKLRLLKNIKKQKYDVLFILDKAYLAGLFGFATGIKTRIGFNRGKEGFANTINVKYGSLKHEIDYYLDLARVVGAKEKSKKIDLFVSKEDIELVDKLTKGIKNFIGIVPGGAKNPGGAVVGSRRWPKEKFIELINKIPKKYSILLLGGKSDFELNKHILLKCKRKKIFNFAGKTNISQSCELMRRCKLVICSDSGPMHIASASGAKVISLFGPTNPARKAPLTKGSVALWKDEDIYEPDVEIYGKNPKNRDYFKRLSVEEVLVHID
ncbi:glycosyltransferase family 9 protein [Candidatus Woesearchaeota archaeon]|nr:glycosyltransferase family 9 protein [Candidatus Woesearchaeota archaeon]